MRNCHEHHFIDPFSVISQLRSGEPQSEDSGGFCRFARTSGDVRGNVPRVAVHASRTPTTISVNIGGTLRTFETVVYRGSDLPESAVTRIWEMPEAEYQEHLARMEAMVASLENTYAERPWTDTVEGSLRFSPASPITQTYATIKVGGSVVATIDNQGVTSSDDALSQMIQDFMADRAGGSNGPALAQDLADELAAMLGGRVVIADTAMTQQEFDALPPHPRPIPSSITRPCETIRGTRRSRASRRSGPPIWLRNRLGA